MCIDKVEKYFRSRIIVQFNVSMNLGKGKYAYTSVIIKKNIKIVFVLAISALRLGRHEIFTRRVRGHGGSSLLFPGTYRHSQMT